MKYLKILSCEVVFREICMAAAKSRNLVELDFLTQGYHDNPDIGRSKIQGHIDEIEDDKFDAILLGYGLCNNMLVGLTARGTPLVIPRAHDCITFFLGSKERYREIFIERPGTYYYTSGWLEYRRRSGERVPKTQSSGLGPQLTYQQLVEQYGEDNAEYLTEFMNHWVQNYTHGVLIKFDFVDRLNLRESVQQICLENGWSYDEVEGDMTLIQNWLDGEWDEEDFLIVQPGETVYATYDNQIVEAK